MLGLSYATQVQFQQENIQRLLINDLVNSHNSDNNVACRSIHLFIQQKPKHDDMQSHYIVQ